VGSAEPAIEAEELGKAYRMYRGPLARVTEAVSFGAFRGHSEFWALRGVSFACLPGASLGLVGANGAGKSTLLKVLAGTTAPTEGRYRIRGRVASLLELGAGFHMDFSGRANIVMNGIMMGFSRREIEAKVDEIVEFAELGSYIDEPVRTYSSGMGLRLGFSVAMAVDPDVMIIDEVFAVGDMYFQKKCVDKIFEFKRRNKTILFCSHSLYDVRQMCDRAIWLERGRDMAQGDAVVVTNEYSAFQRQHIGDMQSAIDAAFPARAQGSEPGRPMPFVRDARIYRLGTDEEVYRITTGDSIEVRVWWSNPTPSETPIHLGIGFMRQDMTICAGLSTQFDRLRLEGNEGCVALAVPTVRLLSGQFLVPVLLLDGQGVHRYQQFLLPENLIVQTSTKDLGLFRFEHSWRIASHPVPGTRAQAEEGAAR
jgi:ABC-type polysaccharide/polyol phosphate transport system ATPase subunit